MQTACFFLVFLTAFLLLTPKEEGNSVLTSFQIASGPLTQSLSLQNLAVLVDE